MASQTFTNDAATAALTNTTSPVAVTAASSSKTNLTVSYDVATATYTVATAAGSQTFGPFTGAAENRTSSRTVGTNRDVLTLTRKTSGTLATQYVGLGRWERGQTSGSIQNSTFDVFAYGLETPAAAVPRVGGATYGLTVAGVYTQVTGNPRSYEGTGAFNVDFQTGHFSMSASGIMWELFGRSFGVGPVEMSGAGRVTGGAFTGTFYLDLILSGELNGRFFGPAGEEVGGTFSGTNSVGSALTGAFAGPRTANEAGKNFTLTNVTVTESQSRLNSSLLLRPNGAGGSVVFQDRQTPSVTFYPNGDFQLFLNGTPSYAQTTYTAADAVSDSGRPNFRTFSKPVEGVPSRLSLYSPGPGNTELALSYASFGLWEQGTPLAVTQSQLFFAYGLLTDNWSRVTLSGSAHYVGVAYGAAFDAESQTRYSLSGTSILDVDLRDLHTFNGTLALTGTAELSGASRNFGIFQFGTVGPFAVNTVPASQGGQSVGDVTANFYGPAAEEMAGTFKFQVPNSSTSSGATYLSGVMAGKR